jgi:hypothetical protein
MQIIWDTSQDNTKDLKVTLRRNIGMSTSPEFKNPLLERNKGTSLLMLRMIDSNYQRAYVKMYPVLKWYPLFLIFLILAVTCDRQDTQKNLHWK